MISEYKLRNKDMSLDWTHSLWLSYLDIIFFQSHLLCLRGLGGCWSLSQLHLGEAGYITPGPVTRFIAGSYECFWCSLPCSRASQLSKVSRHTFQNSFCNQSSQYPTGWATAIIIAIIKSSVKAHKLPPNSWNILKPTVKCVFSDVTLINIYALQKHCCNINGLHVRDQTASTCSSVSEEPTPSGT